MELFSPDWFGALASIIAIDLILAGDNAVVIALAARSLPKHLQRRAVFWGTFGAIAVRILAAFVAVWLLSQPGVSLVGGLLLFWIAYGLVHGDHGKRKGGKEDKEISGFWQAMKTIIIADALMGIDNIVAIAGAARGDVWLVVIGLVISIPIVMGGSVLILRYINKHPWIIWLGAGLLGYTGGAMITQDILLMDKVPVWAGYGVKILPAVVLFVLGWLFHRRHGQAVPPDPGKSPE